MKVTLVPNDVEEKEPPFESNEVYRFVFEFFRGSGNIHIIEMDIIEEIYNSVNDDVIVCYNDGDREKVEDYHICSAKL